MENDDDMKRRLTAMKSVFWEAPKISPEAIDFFCFAGNLYGNW